MATVGVIVGRFQVPAMHDGHSALIANVKQRHDKVVIVLGATTTRLTRRNPLDVGTRTAMVRGRFPDVDVLSIQDVPHDGQWSHALDDLLIRQYPGDEIVLYGGRESFLHVYEGNLECRRLPTIFTTSATELRDRITVPEDDNGFRRGVIYASKQRYPTSWQAVDTAVLNGGMVLLGQKKTDMGDWRFIGGFVDPSDTSLEQAARREVCEETTMIETADYKYIGSARIDDPRYRTDVDKIMSAMFTAQYVFGSPHAGDDLDAVAWFKLDEGILDKLVRHHVPLGMLLLAERERRERH